jgi:predicted nucleotidyltransferase
MQQDRKIIYQVESGSQLYGTTLPESDVDYSSVFMPTSYDIFSLQKCDYINDSTKSSTENRRNTAEDVDNQKYSLQRFMHLVLHGNPNLLEVLFCKNPIIEDPIFTPVKENVHRFIAKHIYKSFTGFAISQKKKLQYKALRFKQLEDTLKWFEKKRQDQIVDSSAQMSEEDAVFLNGMLSEYKGKKNNRESFHQGLPIKIIYEKIKAEYDDYGWRVHTNTFERLGYDVKFGAHAIRLFYEGIQLLTKKNLEFPITGQAYDDIMSIRRGDVGLEGFYELCDQYEEKNRKALDQSDLPDEPDWKWANQYLVDTLEKYIVSNSLIGNERCAGMDTSFSIVNSFINTQQGRLIEMLAKMPNEMRDLHGAIISGKKATSSLQESYVGYEKILKLLKDNKDVLCN